MKNAMFIKGVGFDWNLLQIIVTFRWEFISNKDTPFNKHQQQQQNYNFFLNDNAYVERKRAFKSFVYADDHIIYHSFQYFIFCFCFLFIKIDVWNVIFIHLIYFIQWLWFEHHWEPNTNEGKIETKHNIFIAFDCVVKYLIYSYFDIYSNVLESKKKLWFNNDAHAHCLDMDGSYRWDCQMILIFNALNIKHINLTDRQNKTKNKLLNWIYMKM